jgi:hypothetical protein
MEKARPDGAVDFNDGGNPGRIATWSLGSDLSQMLAEAASDASELRRRLRYESVSYIVGMFHDEPFDVIVEGGYFTCGQSNLALSLSGPHQGPIESFRCQVRCEKRDGIKSQRSGRRHRGTKITMIGLLHRSAATNSDIRPLRPNRRNALTDQIERSLDPPDSIVDFLRTIDRDNHVVEECGDLAGALEQQQSGRQQRETNILLQEKFAERGKIAVQQRFAPGQDYLADTKIAQRCAMPIQVGDSDLLMRFPLPDVTHDAAAVAVGVDIQNQDRHGCQLRPGFRSDLRPDLMQQRHDAPSFRRHEDHSPKTLPRRPAVFQSEHVPIVGDHLPREAEVPAGEPREDA